jgi:hypothetical protein
MSLNLKINRVACVSALLLVFAGHPSIAIAQSEKSIDEAIQWLEKKKASNPATTERAMQTCKQQLPAQGAIGDLLNCMHKILGD